MVDVAHAALKTKVGMGLRQALNLKTLNRIVHCKIACCLHQKPHFSFHYFERRGSENQTHGQQNTYQVGLKLP